MPWGALYLTFEAPTPNGPRVWVNQLAADGQSLVGPAAEILAPEFRWEAKTSPRSGVVENPYMLVTNAGLYLFYSANNWQTDEYAIGVAKCVTPIGPCLRVYTTSFVHSTGTIVGPGGASIAAMPDGSLQLFFHAWVGGIGYDAGGVRELFSTPLRFYLGVPIASGQP
jgi:hypothetical protein